MLAQREPRRFNHREYLGLEEQADVRSEYYHGKIYSMTGSSVCHNQILRNLTGFMVNSLRGGPCQAFMTGLRLYIEEHDLFTYPDLFVVCVDLQMYGSRSDTLTDATLVVEVLSPSTEVYDRGEKFLFYQSLPSIQEYVLISQDSPTVEIRQKVREGEWHTKETVGLAQSLELKSIDAHLDLSLIYEGVDLKSTS